MKKIEFTQEGLTKIKAELEDLVKNKKNKAIDRLQKARAMGDLSENSEYTAAKEDLAFVEGRTRELEEIIKNAVVVEHSNAQNAIEIGCSVIVDMNGKQEEFTLVGEFEANPMERKLSQSSPIGKALLGKKKGDLIFIEVPAGKMMYKILEVKQ